MSGCDEIIEKIIKDARNKANSTSEEASIKASETLSVANNDAQIFFEKNMQESYIERDEIIRRKKSSALLESRKLLLKTKQAIISKSFEQAIKEIKSDEKKYKALISKMIQKADDGDEIIISKHEKDTLSESFILESIKKTGKKVSLCGEKGDFIGGIIIKGISIDKNMTLEVELASIRDANEPKIVDMLFNK
jgi:vacuolar-type H+-ATPase subunit E/Vma4